MKRKFVEYQKGDYINPSNIDSYIAKKTLKGYFKEDPPKPRSPRERDEYAVGFGVLWSASGEVRVDWQHFFTIYDFPLPELPFLRPRSFYSWNKKSLHRATTYLYPICGKTDVDPISFRTTNTWHSPVLGLQDATFRFECRFEHKQSREKHYLAFSQFSISLSKEFPISLYTETLELIHPGMTLIFTPRDTSIMDLSLIVDDLWSSWFNMNNIGEDRETYVNAILNTLRIQLWIEHSSSVNHCQSCGRFHSSVPPIGKCHLCSSLESILQ